MSGIAGNVKNPSHPNEKGQIEFRQVKNLHNQCTDSKLFNDKERVGLGLG